MKKPGIGSSPAPGLPDPGSERVEPPLARVSLANEPSPFPRVVAKYLT